MIYSDMTNDDIKDTIPIVPTSGVTGEGIPDMLSVIIKYTSVFMKGKVNFLKFIKKFIKMLVKENEFNCTVMEVKMTEGYGHTIDCILIDGVMRKDDRIVMMGFDGPIVTKIRALFTPHPMKEMRVKGEYLNHEIIYASQGLKIAAPDLEKVVAGSQL